MFLIFNQKNLEQKKDVFLDTLKYLRPEISAELGVRSNLKCLKKHFFCLKIF